MRILRKLLPGQAGTKKFVRQYGEDLVCVRYRYNDEQKIKATTIEVIVEKIPWNKDPKRIPKNKIMRVSIDYDAVELRRNIISVGGKWNKSEQVWELAYKDVIALGLVDRITQKKEV